MPVTRMLRYWIFLRVAQSIVHILSQFICLFRQTKSPSTAGLSALRTGTIKTLQLFLLSSSASFHIRNQKSLPLRQWLDLPGNRTTWVQETCDRDQTGEFYRTNLADPKIWHHTTDRYRYKTPVRLGSTRKKYPREAPLSFRLNQPTQFLWPSAGKVLQTRKVSAKLSKGPITQVRVLLAVECGLCKFDTNAADEQKAHTQQHRCDKQSVSKQSDKHHDILQSTHADSDLRGDGSVLTKLIISYKKILSNIFK